MQGPQGTSTAKLDGKTVVITGSNTGIGRTTALDMSRRGAKVVMLCRDMEKAEKVAAEIRDATKGEVIVHKLDLADLASVRECAEQLGNSLEKIDILINNAGIMACPKMKTKDGFEMQFGTNHLGHFLLTNLLMPQLEQAAAGIFGTLGIVLVIAGLLYLLKRWMQGPQVTSKAKLDGKTVVITGSNTGIGRTTALDMSRRGAKVVMLCRDMEKAEKVAAEIWEDINYDTAPYDRFTSYSQSK